MTEKELIDQLRKLNQIRPNQDWVLLAKKQILSQELIGKEGKIRVLPLLSLIFRAVLIRPVLIGIFVLVGLLGTFGSAQKSLPGDLLYPIKKITEKGRAVFVSQPEEKVKLDLELANKRLEELNQIVQKNEVQKLAPAIKETQTKLSQVAENLKKDKKVIDKEVLDKVVQIEKNKERIEESLATKIGPEEKESDPTQVIVELLIKDLEKRSLTEEQKEIFAQAKEDFEASDYSSALEKLLLLSQGEL